jgi:hypothetical protein
VFRKIIFVSLLAVSLSAQSTYVPPVLPPIFSASDSANSVTMMVNIGNAVQTRDNFILKHDVDINNLQQTVGAPTTGLIDRIAALEAAVKALQNQPPPPPPPPSLFYALAFSTNAARSGSANLMGAIVVGSVYIYSATANAIQNDLPTGVASVCYWLDNVAMTGAATHCEAVAPWDFQGGTVAAALPWNSASIPNGTHTLTQKMTLLAGGTEVDTASFTVAN